MSFVHRHTDKPSVKTSAFTDKTSKVCCRAEKPIVGREVEFIRTTLGGVLTEQGVENLEIVLEDMRC